MLLYSGKKAEFTAEYQTLLDFAIANGIGIPSESQRIIQNKLIKDYKYNGLWDKEKVMYVMANDGSKEFATLNWKDPTTYRLIPSASGVTFTSNIGLTTSGATGVHINTQYHPHFDNITYNVNSEFTVAISGVFAGFKTILGCSDGVADTSDGLSRILLYNGSSNMQFFHNTTAGLYGGSYVAGDNISGIYSVFVNTPSLKVDKNSANFTTNNNWSSNMVNPTLDKPIFLGAGNSGSTGAITRPSAMTFKYFGYSSGDSITNITKDTLISQYLTDILL